MSIFQIPELNVYLSSFLSQPDMESFWQINKKVYETLENYVYERKIRQLPFIYDLSDNNKELYQVSKEKCNKLTVKYKWDIKIEKSNNNVMHELTPFFRVYHMNEVISRYNLEYIDGNCITKLYIVIPNDVSYKDFTDSFVNVELFLSGCCCDRISDFDVMHELLDDDRSIVQNETHYKIPIPFSLLGKPVVHAHTIIEIYVTLKKDIPINLQCETTNTIISNTRKFGFIDQPEKTGHYSIDKQIEIWTGRLAYLVFYFIESKTHEIIKYPVFDQLKIKVKDVVFEANYKNIKRMKTYDYKYIVKISDFILDCNSITFEFIGSMENIHVQFEECKRNYLICDYYGAAIMFSN